MCHSLVSVTGRRRIGFNNTLKLPLCLKIIVSVEEESDLTIHSNVGNIAVNNIAVEEESDLTIHSNKKGNKENVNQ